MAHEKRPANYQPEIHGGQFMDQYRETAIDHRTLLNDADRPRESLDGIWNFAPDQYYSSLRGNWYAGPRSDEHGNPRPPDFAFDDWQKVDVPSCWNMVDPKFFLYEGGAVYTRTFRFRADERGGRERLFLKVGAANYESILFLNGSCLGHHLGGNTPFFVEVTSQLAQENRLFIFVTNRRERSQVPTDNTDWFNYGGIYRSVELIRVPATFIRRYQVALVPGSDFGRISVSVEVDGAKSTGTARVRIPALGVERSFEVSSGAGSTTFEARPQLWAPGAPVLYDVEIAYGDADLVRDRIGFREVSVVGQSVFLNGKPLYLKGISCHEESLDRGKAVSAEDIHSMFDVATDLGCNFIRLAHYPHTEQAARIADERGILLWEEIPVYWAVDFANADTYADAENQLAELVLRDLNRASVILWSVGNENPDTDERLQFMSRLAARTRQLDPTRLVTAACLWNRELNRIEDRLAEHLDVVGLNEYYGWYEGNFADLAAFFANSTPDKPIIVSEFGGGARTGHHGTVDDLFTEEKQRDVYERQLQVLGRAQYVAGMTPWLLFDFRSPRRLNNLQNGFNLKGLVDADRRRRKLAFDTLRAFYAER